MKLNKTIILSLIAVVLVLFTACQKPTNPVEPGSGTEGAALLMAVVPDAQAPPSDLSTATETQEFKMMPPMGRGMLPFGQILTKLNLDSLQKVQVKGFMKTYQDCIEAAMAELRASEKQIIQDANVARKAIMDQVKAGTLTKQEAAKQIVQLNKDTRTLLANNPARAIAEAAVKACRDTFFAAVRGILTTDQQTKWDDWVSKLNSNTNPTNPGDGHGKGGKHMGGNGGPMGGHGGPMGGKH